MQVGERDQPNGKGLKERCKIYLSEEGFSPCLGTGPQGEGEGFQGFGVVGADLVQGGAAYLLSRRCPRLTACQKPIGTCHPASAATLVGRRGSRAKG